MATGNRGSNRKHNSSNKYDACSNLECKFSRETMDLLNDMRHQGQLCDVKIIVNNLVFHAHRIILAACSPYFRAMFTSNMKESTGPEVVLHDLHAKAIEAIIDFAYTHKLAITSENAHSLLAASSILQIFRIQTECCEYLSNHLDVFNCLAVRNLADMYSCKKLLELTESYILKNFEHLAEISDEFLVLEVDELIKIVKDDNLYLPSGEESAYEAVMKWINYTPDISVQSANSKKPINRLKYLADLMQHIRFSQMDLKYLAGTVSNDPLIVSNKKCFEYIAEAKQYLSLSSVEDKIEILSLKSSLKPRRGHSTLYLFKDADSVSKYNQRTDVWTEIAGTKTEYYCDSRVTVSDDAICIIDDSKTIVEYYKPESGESTCDAIVSPIYERHSYGVVVHDGYLYLIGGIPRYESRSLNLVEKYSFSVREWTTCPPLKTKRHEARVVVIDNSIYVLGGGKGREELVSVERYDTALNRWQFVAPMKEKRDRFSCVAVDGYIYVLGGRNFISSCQTGERYDPKNDEWQPIATPPPDTGPLSLASMNGLIYAVSRSSEYKNSGPIYIYDTVSQK